jgi:hypothetical protein
MIDFISLNPANPDHEPADNRNGGTSTMTKEGLDQWPTRHFKSSKRLLRQGASLG